jgi:hypothetical protein
MNQKEVYDMFTMYNILSPKLPLNENISKYNKLTEYDDNEQNEKLKFITKRRGRKIKESDNKINEEKMVHTKFSNDNIKRRIKALYNSYIIILLNNLIKERFTKIKMKFIKIYIRATKDIGIIYNRNLLNSKIKDIIINASNKYKDLDNNKKCIKFIEEQKNNEEILNILNMTYKDLYNDYYLKSTKDNNGDNSFEAHKEKILKLYGKEYLDKYIKNTENFVEFFMNGKNRKCRKPKEVDTIDIPTEENELIKTGSTNDTNLNNLLDNKKQMVSSFAQTEICDINSKLIAIY